MLPMLDARTDGAAEKNLGYTTYNPSYRLTQAVTKEGLRAAEGSVIMLEIVLDGLCVILNLVVIVMLIREARK